MRVNVALAFTFKARPPPIPSARPATDAPFRMDLDDSVMIKSAALWPPLAPQWKDPAKWWKQLCLADGKKDYDWSHLARRYFPDRGEEVRNRPQPGRRARLFLEVPPREGLRLGVPAPRRDRPDFTIDEPDSDSARARFLADHAPEADSHEAEGDDD